MEIPEAMLLMIDRCSVSKTSRQSLHFVFPLAPPKKFIRLIRVLSVNLNVLTVFVSHFLNYVSISSKRMMHKLNQAFQTEGKFHQSFEQKKYIK